MTAELLAYLTVDEVAAWRETDDWLHGEASRFKKMLGLTRKPLEYAYSKVPESLRDSIASAIFNILSSLRDGTAGLISPETVQDRLGPVPEGPLGMYLLGVRHLDGVAQSLIGQSKNLCTAEGAATGVAGLPGIVVDIPALYTLLFRMIAQVALCYGYRVDSEEERSHILKVLDIGHQWEPEVKRQGMHELDQVQQMIRDNLPVVEVQRFAVNKGLEAMARALGLALTQRKLIQSLALVGSVVGAGVNRQLAGEVGDVAYHAYRRRFLIELAYLRRRAEQGPSTASSSGPEQSSADAYLAPDTGELEELPPAVAAQLEAEETGSLTGPEREGSSPEMPQEVATMQEEPDIPPTAAIPQPAQPPAWFPTGGEATVTLAASDLNLLLQRLEHPVEYRHGCLLARAKLPISAIRLLIIPSCTPTHIVFTIPFNEVKSEGAGSFLLSRILSTFWTTIGKQIEGTLVPKLQQRGFSRDLVGLERGKGQAGEYGQVRISLAALNDWLRARHPQLRASLISVAFSPESIRLLGRLETA